MQDIVYAGGGPADKSWSLMTSLANILDAAVSVIAALAACVRRHPASSDAVVGRAPLLRGPFCWRPVVATPSSFRVTLVREAAHGVLNNSLIHESINSGMN